MLAGSRHGKQSLTVRPTQHGYDAFTDNTPNEAHTMLKIVIIETETEARNAIRLRIGALGEEARVVASVEEAQDVAEAHPGILAIVRGRNVASRAAGIACGFDLAEGARLILFESLDEVGPVALTRYLQELDHVIARFSMPRRAPGAGDQPLPDFPYEAFEPLRRLGGLPGADFVLLRNRIADRKEIVVQISEFDEHAAAVSDALFSECARFRNTHEVRNQRMFRIEMSRNHSYVWIGDLPLSLADRMQGAAARPPRSVRVGLQPNFA